MDDRSAREADSRERALALPAAEDYPVVSAVDSIGGSEQFADPTTPCTQDTGVCPEGENTVKELTLDAKIANISEALDFIDALLEAAGCPLKAQTQINVAADEILSNIASYAYAPGSGDMTVRFELREDPRTAVITFMDRGMPFNPLEIKEPDVTLPAEERAIGGLGIFLVKKTMDDIQYELRNGMNILRIEKRI